MYDASYFQDKPKMNYSEEKEFIPVPKGPHNQHMVKNAEGNAKANRKNPSELDKKMMDLLSGQGVHYEYQKPVYIKSSGGFIKQYFIVDFWIPARNIIIEIRARKPNTPYKYDTDKQKAIKTAYPVYTIVEWYGENFSSLVKMKQLISLLKPEIKSCLDGNKSSNLAPSDAL